MTAGERRMYGTPESLVCPVCRAALRRDGSSLVCGGARRHCYDIAASGYVNLLPPGKASNAKTGDDRRMLSSRSAFLSTGVYDEFSREIARLADKNLSVGDGRVMFADAGCGEGYHTLNIARCLDGAGRSVCFAGFDASKYGADRASKRLKSERGLFPDSVFAAANIFDMPLRGCCHQYVCACPVGGSAANPETGRASYNMLVGQASSLGDALRAVRRTAGVGAAYQCAGGLCFAGYVDCIVHGTALRRRHDRGTV